ncbi:hypothetical protein PFWH6_2431 [Pseudomonas fluorescens WH6]|nr:hypothetical protein PFWH6_2431 [Pseudomonas fluorescens WH6]
MKTVYINESGVRPWKSINPTNDARLTTTTLLDHGFNSVWESWRDVMTPYPTREWSATTNVDFNLKTDEYLYKKTRRTHLILEIYVKKMKKATFIPLLKTAQAILKKYKTWP